MEPFASAFDYFALYDTNATDDRLDALLCRASRDIASELRAAGIPYDNPDEDFAADLADVACSMVHRALGEDGECGFVLHCLDTKEDVDAAKKMINGIGHNNESH